MATFVINIHGRVQGVGFRPFIYRLAVRNELKGWVENRTDGVRIKINAEPDQAVRFVRAIREEKPPASHIVEIISKEDSAEDFSDFRILKSENSGEEITQVSPDIALCKDCLEDMKTQSHRLDYPFINCTNCGPRFTIIRDLPYDREKTSMKPFRMCERCRAEYTEILDRRFHAQPVACSLCGPEYKLHCKKEVISDFDQIIRTSAELIREGKILAIKGMGGYFLACDAQNEKAVDRLRLAKNRDGKPFAVMFRNMDSLKEFLHMQKPEEDILQSWRRPILLAKKKKSLASGVSVGFSTTGAMLPYMPLHYLLFEKLELPAIVLTSGNISEEPIIIDDKKALEVLGPFSDAVLTYNREIHNRTDDSVTTYVNGRERLLRRSRGYVPEPFIVSNKVEGILATGAELVNCFSLGRNRQAIMSQHIGDLKNLETLEFYRESIGRFKKLFQFNAELIAHDLHPDYLSTRWAKEQNIKLLGIQHHHAHIASCMAEHGLDEKVIGVAMDGVGYGDDGKIWGGEFLLCDYAGYERKLHFEYIPMPGGDAATKNPWRMLLGYLYHYQKEDLQLDQFEVLQSIAPDQSQLVLDMLRKDINSPLTSSAGRLFDAVSALLGLCTTASFHAEAPMKLESAAAKNINDSYSFTIAEDISFKETFTAIIADLNRGMDKGIISAKFHNTLINTIFAAAKKISLESGINKVALSGGTFQNRYLLEGVETKLSENGYKVFSQEKIPANDGGLALGQLMIAAEKRRLACV
ncbi:MAG: carbamoyltransferase HypF [Bacteroidales bacterium]|nr:carbamoyltransferase HypF [Bacteroidales bacterium]MCF8388229.1 carbamoyltransferase HypF [Bacteroidales bacterium]MCF8398407.1 carbamoyltransferase HypF [Bacteroidales bacterium]